MALSWANDSVEIRTHKTLRNNFPDKNFVDIGLSFLNGRQFIILQFYHTLILNSLAEESHNNKFHLRNAADQNCYCRLIIQDYLQFFLNFQILSFAQLFRWYCPAPNHP